jgi:hypothetical protein
MNKTPLTDFSILLKPNFTSTPTDFNFLEPVCFKDGLDPKAVIGVEWCVPRDQECLNLSQGNWMYVVASLFPTKHYQEKQTLDCFLCSSESLEPDPDKTHFPFKIPCELPKYKIGDCFIDARTGCTAMILGIQWGNPNHSAKEFGFFTDKYVYTLGWVKKVRKTDVWDCGLNYTEEKMEELSAVNIWIKI